MSAYEEIRQANIQRNQRFLKDIGIGTENSTSSNRAAPTKGAKKLNTEIALPLRRSSRGAVVHLPTNAYKETPDKRSTGQKRGASEIEEDTWEGGPTERVQYTGLLATAPPLSVVAHGAGVSCSQCKANIAIMAGPKMLGFPMTSFGKLAVIATAAPKGGVPKFNKYAGALRWLNCVFLWVNIERSGVSSGGYNNEFTVQPPAKGGKAECLLTWYGSSKMRRDSDITQLILGAGVDDADSLPVLLFVRIVGENYVSCGRVTCVHCDEIREHGAGTVLKFTLRLSQFDQGLADQSAFRNILKESTKS